jgi:hypothetical protein
VTDRPDSAPAANLVAELRTTEAELTGLLATVAADEWTRVPAPSTWSVGKNAAHIAEAAVYHQWIVRQTIGDQVPSRRPAIERAQLTTTMSRSEAVELIRRRTDESAALIARLTPDQLALPTQPPRVCAETLGATIERVLIGHYHAHWNDIERKLRAGR